MYWQRILVELMIVTVLANTCATRPPHKRPEKHYRAVITAIAPPVVLVCSSVRNARKSLRARRFAYGGSPHPLKNSNSRRHNKSHNTLLYIIIILLLRTTTNSSHTVLCVNTMIPVYLCCSDCAATTSCFCAHNNNNNILWKSTRRRVF